MSDKKYTKKSTFFFQVSPGKFEKITVGEAAARISARAKNPMFNADDHIAPFIIAKLTNATLDTSDWSEDITKAWKPIDKQITALVTAHEAEAKEQAKAAEAEAAAKAKAKEEEKLAKEEAAKRALGAELIGEKTSEAIVLTGFRSGLSQRFEKVEFSELGLTVHEGESITLDEGRDMISTLAATGKSADAMKTSGMWYLGDLLAYIKRTFFTDAKGKVDTDGLEKVIGEACASTGNSRQTVVQSARLAEAFPVEKRYAGFSATHHQELLNHQGRYQSTDKKEAKSRQDLLEAIIQKALTGGRSAVIKNPDGTQRVEATAVSASAFRKMLVDGAPWHKTEEKKPESKEPGNTPSSTVAQDSAPETVYVAPKLFILVDYNGVAFTKEALTESEEEGKDDLKSGLWLTIMNVGEKKQYSSDDSEWKPIEACP